MGAVATYKVCTNRLNEPKTWMSMRILHIVAICFIHSGFREGDILEKRVSSNRSKCCRELAIFYSRGMILAQLANRAPATYGGYQTSWGLQRGTLSVKSDDNSNVHGFSGGLYELVS